MLQFSDREFSHFFGREIRIDIDDPKYAIGGNSKGKRLRSFFELTDDLTAARTLKALWSARVCLLADTAQVDPVARADERYQALLVKLGSLSTKKTNLTPPAAPVFEGLKAKLLAIDTLLPHPRGYAFQEFLYGVFEAHGTDARRSFRNRGEEIDGSFNLGGNLYLLEAKWQAKPVGAAVLHSFEGKLTEKAPWVRGLFVSHAGFSPDGLVAFGRAKRSLCMDGYDLFEMLDRQLTLDQVLEAKARRAAETGMPFVQVRDLFLKS